ncbi:MAG: class II aldolase/adducin family protein [Gammaproteobacteria bacterium]
MPKTATLQTRRPSRFSAEEWQLRVQLAACYRIFDYLGWIELIYNHISLRLPGPDHHFLINPFGLWYKEVTASNLVKIDLDGNIVGPSEYSINRAGFVIHSAIHAAREDALCVMHTHTTAAMAVACQEAGLRMDNFYAAFLGGQIAYHDFQGLVVYERERQDLVQSLGDKPILMLRNHGPLTVGRTISQAFQHMWTLQRACEVQLAAHAAGAPVIPISAAAVEASQRGRGNDSYDNVPSDQRMYAALVRKIDAIDPSYKT